MEINSLSVFLPAFNEEENIASTIKNVQEGIDLCKLKNYEIIVVNDASTDQTVAKVQSLQKEYPKLRLVSHPVNMGYGGALKTGFQESKYEWVAFTDSDGQFDFKEITKFIDQTDRAEVIVGYRIVRADPFRRIVLTYGWKTIALILLGLSVKDYSCGFKLIKKSVYTAVLPLETEEKVTQIEFLVKAKKKGFRFAEVGVNHYPRRFGSPTGGSIFSKVFFKSFADLFTLWWKLR